MLNVIPGFIQNKLEYSPDKRSGNFPGVSLFVDIAGFTKITETLMSQGRHGAEDLSVLINKVYRPLIEKVHRKGGFISVFAGDSITALFPGNSRNTALEAAVSINKHFARRTKYYLRFSHGEGIEVRTGLAAGDVSWVIFGERRKAYLFYGDPVLQCSKVVQGKPPGSLVRHRSFSSYRESYSEPMVPSPRIKPSMALQFVPKQVLASGKYGEFRNAVAVFMTFKPSLNATDLNRVVSEVLATAGRYGGFWNGMFYDDKGLHALIVFGAPVSYENNTRRAMGFSRHTVSRNCRLLKAGVSGGTVYAGMVGTSRRCTYTILGDQVNLAARIMEESRWGQVLVSDDIAPAVSKSFRLEQAKSSSNESIFRVAEEENITDERFFFGKMMGRDRELTTLLDFCKPIFKGGFAGMASVSGPAGIGKSRLLHELEKELAARAQIFVLQTDQVLRKGLNPFVQFLTGYFGQADTSGKNGEENFHRIWAELISRLKSYPDRHKSKPVVEELCRTRPFLGALTGIPEKDAVYESLDSKGKFENTLIALKEFVKALSLLAPTVIIVEDIHWLDSDSEALLNSLTRNAEGFPYVIIASSRPEDDGTIPALTGDIGVRTKTLVLKPLSETSEILVMKELLSGDPSDDLSAFILKRTQGNPFFMDQFCRYLGENLLLEDTDGFLDLANRTVEIPDGINAVIVARIDRLSLKLKELVQTASVLGREFDVQILSTILQGDPGRIYPLLHEGESETIWSAVNEVRYIFRHSILRDTVYHMQMQKQLCKLHLLAAEAIESCYGEEQNRYSEIAYHLEKGSDFKKAPLFLKKAADYARDEYRNDEALDLYRRLLALCSHVKDEIETEIQIANILIDKGQREEAQDIIMSNMKKAEKAGSPFLEALCCKNMAKLHHRQGNNNEAISHLNKALAIYRELGNTWEIAGSLNVLGNINTVLGNYDEALQNFAESTEAAETAGDRITSVLNISNLGNIYLYRYELDKAESYYLKAIEECREINDRIALANALNNLAVVSYNREDYHSCRRYLDQFVEISTEIGNREGLAYIYGNLGILHQELGEYDTAIEYHEKQIALARELGDRYNIARATQQTGQLHKFKGNYAAAAECITQAAKLSEDIGDLRNQAQCVRDLGGVYLEAGDYEKASVEFHRAYRLGQTGSDMEVCSSSRLYLAHMAVVEGNFVLAREYADDAVRANKEISEHHSLPNTLVLAAGILIETGDCKRAGEILAEAESLIEENCSDETWWKYRIAMILLKAEKNPEGTADELISLLEDLSDHEELEAEVYLHLFQHTGDIEYRREAVERYTALHGKTPRMRYIEKLNLLQNPQR